MATVIKALLGVFKSNAILRWRLFFIVRTQFGCGF